SAEKSRAKPAAAPRIPRCLPRIVANGMTGRRFWGTVGAPLSSVNRSRLMFVRLDAATSRDSVSAHKKLDARRNRLLHFELLESRTLLAADLPLAASSLTNPDDARAELVLQLTKPDGSK